MKPSSSPHSTPKFKSDDSSDSEMEMARFEDKNILANISTNSSLVNIHSEDGSSISEVESEDFDLYAVVNNIFSARSPQVENLYLREEPQMNASSCNNSIASLRMLLPKASVYLPCIKGDQFHRTHDTGYMKKGKRNIPNTNTKKKPKTDCINRDGSSVSRMEPNSLILNIPPVVPELRNIIHGGHCSSQFCFTCGPGLTTITPEQIITKIDFNLEAYNVFKIRWNKIKNNLLDGIKDDLWHYSLAPKLTFLKLFEQALCSISIDRLHKTVLDKCFLNGGRLELFYFTIEDALQKKNSIIHFAPKLRLTVMVQVMAKFITFVFGKDTYYFNFQEEIDKAVAQLKLPEFLVIKKSIMSDKVSRTLSPLLEDLEHEADQFCDGRDEGTVKAYSPSLHNLCLSNCSNVQCQKKYTGFDKSVNGTWGLFALEPILKDEYIEVLCGRVRLGNAVSEYTIRYDNFCLDLRTAGSIGRFINHSCNPNTKFMKNVSAGSPVIFIKALRDIRMYEEITASYNGKLWFECKCGMADCVSKKVD